jgi:serine/threonine-protein kinase RsbW
MIKKLKIESEIGNLRIVENAIDSITNESGIGQDSYGKILVASLEAVNNAIIHGNKSDRAKYVVVEILMEKNILKVKVTDEGPGFKPGEIPDPTMPENIELLNGRGVFLMTKLADDIKFNSKGNCVTMTFKNIMH